MSGSSALQMAAKKAIESLRDSGQPPKLGASTLNVGTDHLLADLRKKYLDDHCASLEGEDGGGACKWIEADYGNGKTQFLRCVQEIGWEHNFVVGYVELSQDESPLDRPERVFSAAARSLQAQPNSPVDVDRTRGLNHVLEQLLDRKFPDVLSGLPDDGLRADALDWVHQSFRNTPVESTALATAATVYLTAKLKGEPEREEIAKLYLRGEAIPLPELKKIGVFEKLDKSSAFRLLRSVTQLLQRSGLAAGTILLFDEARRTLSLMSTKSQKHACENLLSVINHCNNGDFPGTLFLYAVMPEFFTNFVTAYPALQQRCGPATRVNLNVVQGIKELDLLREIAKKVLAIHCAAYCWAPADGIPVDAQLDQVAKAALRQAMGTGSRRLLVKTTVQLLDQFRDSGVFAVSESEAMSLATGAVEELKAMEAASVDSEGE
ncbi:hypothetical protein LBMAG52_05030 [Planctomycetia bacterium]|nr:hypothetical protein LBMAG52_05030 [Planctomycetia bacterium]